MIRSIKIENFKALGGLTMTFTPFTVLIGDNSVGKTSVLQAIAFLKSCCTSTFDRFLDERNLSADDLFSKLNGARTQKLSFSTILFLAGKEIQWDVTVYREKGFLKLKAEEVSVDGHTVLFYTNGKKDSYRFNAETNDREPIMAGTYGNSIIQITDTVKQSASYPELSAIKTFFSNMETLDMLSPKNMRSGSRGESSVLGLSGERIGAFIKRLPASSQQLLNKDIQKFNPAFSSVAPKVKEKDLVLLDTRETYNGKTVNVSSANISDGLLRIIAFCSLRFLENSGGAILLDEIEDGINNEHLAFLVQILRQIQLEQNVQIIATTHNTLLLDYWVDKCKVDLDTDQSEAQSLESILLLYRSKAGTAVAKNIFDSPSIRDKLSYMYPGEIVQNMTNYELQEALEG